MAARAEDRRVRASIVDDIFYPGEPEALAAMVRELLESSPVQPGQARAVIAPHGAYAYSGRIAAAAFRAAAGRPVEVAVLLGPVHREPVDSLVLPESVSFQTPLGEVPVDTKLVARLADVGPSFRVDDIPHLEEHSLEVPIPFLQVLFPGLAIVPVLTAQGHPEQARQLAAALDRVFADRLDSTLFVVSANMSGYTTRPGRDAEVQQLIDLIGSRDQRGLVEGIRAGRINSCGSTAVAAILAMEGAPFSRVEILQRGTSLDADSDTKTVVHYAAVALS